MIRFAMFAGFLLGGMSVALGAAGAHILKGAYSAETIQTYETAVRYMMFHALGLLAIASIGLHLGMNRLLKAAAGLMFFGTLAFTTGLFGSAFVAKAWGHVAMVGGLSMITSWILAAVGVASTRNLDRQA